MQPSLACSGSGEPGSWTWERPQCHSRRYCSAVCVLPPCSWQKWTGSHTTQPLQPSRAIPPACHPPGGAWLPSCRDQALGWENTHASLMCSPSVPTDSVWLLPLPAPPGRPCSCPGEHRSHHACVWVCWVQPGRQKGACCKQSLSARITWCKAWELLLEDTKAWQLIKAGGKENCSTESYYSHFNFPVEIIQWTSLLIVSQSAIKT